MQFKTKLGLVDIPNEEVIAAASEILGCDLNSFRGLKPCEQSTPVDEERERCVADLSTLRTEHGMP